MAHRKTYRCEQCGYETYDYEGIKIYNLADWLLEKN